jgi:hypothetical protein
MGKKIQKERSNRERFSRSETIDFMHSQCNIEAVHAEYSILRYVMLLLPLTLSTVSAQPTRIFGVSLNAGVLTRALFAFAAGIEFRFSPDRRDGLDESGRVRSTSCEFLLTIGI